MVVGERGRCWDQAGRGSRDTAGESERREPEAGVRGDCLWRGVFRFGVRAGGRLRVVWEDSSWVEELLGGRYGEVPADELRARLVSSGVSLRSVVKEVGTWRAAAAGAKEEKVPVDLKVGVEAAAVSGTVTFSRLQDIVRLG